MDLPTQIRDLALLPTPNASVSQDGEKPGTFLARREVVKAKGINGNGMGMPLTIAVQLLPTPTANIATNGSQHPDKRRAGGHQPSIQDVAEHLLLPTPRTNDGKGTFPLDRPDHMDNLATRIGRLLPTPVVTDSFGSRRATARTDAWESNPGNALTDGI